MTESEVHLSNSAENLRREFDAAFSRLPVAEEGDFVELLNLRVGAQPYAVRLTDVGGLYTGKAVTPVPSSFPELIGVAGFRGTIVPIFDLGTLLGSERTVAARWTLTTASKPPVGLAFTHFEGYRRVRADAVVDRVKSKEAGDWRHAHQVVREDDEARLLVHLPSLVETIQNRVR